MGRISSRGLPDSVEDRGRSMFAGRSTPARFRRDVFSRFTWGRRLRGLAFLGPNEPRVLQRHALRASCACCARCH
eukprot:4380055-Lingulodinium_polyedra.AAC.1